MNTVQLPQLSIASLADGLKKRQFSAREIVDQYLSNIAAGDKELRAYLFVNDDGAREAADAIDKESQSGARESGPLLGVPFAVKDNILVSDWPTTAGSKILESYVAAYEATAISRLRGAGAIFLGKTNMDEFAMGSSTENSAFGPTKNPRDPGRVPGGSSGGSAAAVAADLALAALGSDTGGSIRQPAAFSGIVGLKPTYGRVSRHGLIAMASSLDQIGPLAKSVRDAAMVYQAIAGFDRYDATAVSLPVEKTRAVDLRDVCIGVPKEYFAKGLDPGIEAGIKTALRRFEAAGARLSEVSLPHLRYALSCYYIIMPAEVSANLARYDGIRYGFVSRKAKSLAELYKDTRDEGFGAEAKRRIVIGTYVLSHGYYDAYYAKAQTVRRLIRSDFEAVFKNVDVVMGPTTPSLPFRFGEKSADPVSMYLEDIYTVSVNLAGLPALSMPCGIIQTSTDIDTDQYGKSQHEPVLSPNQSVGLPVGLQIIGKWFDESRLLGIADACESILKQAQMPKQIQSSKSKTF